MAIKITVGQINDGINIYKTNAIVAHLAAEEESRLVGLNVAEYINEPESEYPEDDIPLTQSETETEEEDNKPPAEPEEEASLEAFAIKSEEYALIDNPTDKKGE